MLSRSLLHIEQGGSRQVKGWEGKLHAGAIDVNLGFPLFRAPETRAGTVFVLTASASVRPAHSAHACYSQVCSGLISAVAVAGQK